MTFFGLIPVTSIHTVSSTEPPSQNEVAPLGVIIAGGNGFTVTETDITKLGTNKTLVAAGRVSADMVYSIHLGKPEKSIMIYRLQSLDPGIMMPGMGRRTVDGEGLVSLSKWIKRK